jgi:hypothetical protein
MPDWIPLERGAICLDCKGIFDFAESKGACPKCGTEVGWMLTKVDEKGVRDETAKASDKTEGSSVPKAAARSEKVGVEG